MGRAEYGTPQDGEKYRLFRVRLDNGGYDDGGAYWGTGAPLYCATDDAGGYQQFVRASSRLDAAIKLGIVGHLARPVAGAAPSTSTDYRTSYELKAALLKRGSLV